VQETPVTLVGAGPIGLEMAVALGRRRIPYLHFEADQIASTIAWYAPHMRFHSAADRISLCGIPLQIPDQTKPRREDYLSYLRMLVQHFDLQVRTYERIESVTRSNDRRSGFLIGTRAHTGDAHRVRSEKLILAIGGMHKPRMLAIPGEDLPHVSHYLGDPHTYFRRRVLVVGGRNSAVEAAIRCCRVGAEVVLSYRGAALDPAVVKFWLWPELERLVEAGQIRFLPGTQPLRIERDRTLLASAREDADPSGESPPPMLVGTDFVLLMTGYEQDPTLFEQVGLDLVGSQRAPRLDARTMESNVPGVYVAGTATAGSQQGKIRVIIESCHVHVDRIAEALAAELTTGHVAVHERMGHAATAPPRRVATGLGVTTAPRDLP
jgi:thioredoxin reductase (NADPH)